MSERGIDQLLMVGSHYLALAKRLSSGHGTVLNSTIDNVTNCHRAGELNTGELILAHLASCAIRLSTICEKKGIFPKTYRDFYCYDKATKERRKRKKPTDEITKEITQNLDEYIDCLLRDNISHEENVQTNMAEDRPEILKQLTIAEVLVALDSRIKKIRKAV